jgi:hypothetical protein
MRRGPSVLLALIALIPFTTFASAQTAAPPDRVQMFLGTATLTTQVSPDVVVARVMSFDRDRDGRVV